MMFWDKLAVRSGLPSPPPGAGPFNQLLCFALFLTYFGFLLSQKQYFTKGQHLSLQLSGGICKSGCCHLHRNIKDMGKLADSCVSSQI